MHITQYLLYNALVWGVNMRCFYSLLLDFEHMFVLLFIPFWMSQLEYPSN